MKNKNVGFLIAGIAVVIGVIILIFNLGLRNIVASSCSMGTSCSMYSTISIQTYTSLAVAGLVLVIGLFFIFSKESEKIVLKKVIVEAKRKPVDYSKLDKEEKILVKLLEENDGSIFQADLVEKSGFSKVKVTRILDRLEGKGITERKRRGMTNIVLLK